MQESRTSGSVEGSNLRKVRLLDQGTNGLSKVARPLNSRLDKSKLVETGFTLLPTWQGALSRYLKEIKQ